MTDLLLFIKIGFLEIRWIDLLDIALVSLILYQLYKIIRRSLAFNIFIGLFVIYLLSLIVKAMDMRLLSQIFGQFIGVGVLALIIVFQPEVRRFLLFIGRGSGIRSTGFWKWLNIGNMDREMVALSTIPELMATMRKLSSQKTGALLVFARTSKLQFFVSTGLTLEATMSGALIESIFARNSPLHDGAVIIADNRIIGARCILPVSENPGIPQHLGLRHRSAVGITEHSDAIAIAISEETGQISYASEGQIYINVSWNEIEGVLKKCLVQNG